MHSADYQAPAPHHADSDVPHIQIINESEVIYKSSELAIGIQGNYILLNEIHIQIFRVFRGNQSESIYEGILPIHLYIPPMQYQVQMIGQIGHYLVGNFLHHFHFHYYFLAHRSNLIMNLALASMLNLQHLLPLAWRMG